MSYKILIENGRSCPIIICDHCEERITRSNPGSARWLESVQTKRQEGKLYDVLHTHNGPCSRAYEEQNPEETDQSWMTHGLAVDVGLLLRNIEYHHAEAKRNMDCLESLQ